MSYTAFTSRLETTMEGISALQAVYDYEPENVSGFPCCAIVPNENGKEDTLDSCGVETTYSFRVLIMDDLAGETVTRTEVEARMRSIADDVLDALHVKTLFKPEGALTHIARNMGFKYIEREGGHARAFEVIVEIRKANDLS